MPSARRLAIILAMKIYTRTGDDGSTGLIGGSRVPKSDLRIACIGAVDELNACLGVAAVVCPDELAGWVRHVQNDLFVLGSHLALPDLDDPATAAMLLPPLDEDLVARLEGQIDGSQSQLPPLQQFILPGGSEPAARLHLARTICRRAECLLVDLARHHSVLPLAVTFLNRLGDWLFVMARRANHLAGVADIPWRH